MLRQHYEEIWRASFTVVAEVPGPVHQIGKGFAVLRSPPRSSRPLWTYCTQGMSQPSDHDPLELHMYSSVQADGLAEVLAMAAHYHRTSGALGLNHTVNFGIPWYPDSPYDHGLISLPYLDGPKLEWLDLEQTRVRFLWLIAISGPEVKFKRTLGITALEDRMESTNFLYADPFRRELA